MTVQEQWQFYADKVFQGALPENSAQYIETRRAFFGAWCQCLLLLRDHIGAVSEDEGATILEAQLDEIVKFFKRQTEGLKSD